MNCQICPCACGADRQERAGSCRAPDTLVVANHQLHHWEEPALSGIHGEGSGAIFFSHCNLHCVFCQNHEISQQGLGREVSEDELIEMCFELKRQGALNINLVSPTPYSHILARVLARLRPELGLPIVWNSNAYEKVDTLKSLTGLVDIYLPDLKYCSDDLAVRYSSAPHYFEQATAAIREMRRQQPLDEFDGRGHMTRGLILRHLMLPGLVEDSLAVLAWIRSALGPGTRVSLMAQYYPTYKASSYPEIDRKLEPEEYEQGLDYLIDNGFDDALIQDLDAANSRYTPDFKKEVTDA